MLADVNLIPRVSESQGSDAVSQRRKERRRKRRIQPRPKSSRPENRGHPDEAKGAGVSRYA